MTPIKRDTIEHNVKLMLKHVGRYLDPSAKKHLYPDERRLFWQIEDLLYDLAEIIESDRICKDIFLSGVPNRPEDLQ